MPYEVYPIDAGDISNKGRLEVANNIKYTYEKIEKLGGNVVDKIVLNTSSAYANDNFQTLYIVAKTPEQTPTSDFTPGDDSWVDEG